MLALDRRECKPRNRPARTVRPASARSVGPVAEMHDTTEEYLETILALEEEGVVPMRARLVERLGLSAAAVSETVGRLSTSGYVELDGDRSLRLTDQGPGPRDHGRAPAPPGRAPARRRDRARVGEGPPPRPTAGSTRSPPTSRRSSWCSSATRPRARTATRSRARSSASRRRRPIALADAAVGPGHGAPGERTLEMSDDAGSSLIAGAHLLPGCDATVIDAQRRRRHGERPSTGEAPTLDAVPASRRRDRV